MDKAAAVWRKGFQLNVQEHSRPLNLAPLSPQKGKLTKALAAWQEAIYPAPGRLNYSQFHPHIGNRLAQSGAWDEAIKVYQEIVRLKPGDKKAKRKLTTAHHNLGHTLFEQGKVDEPIEAFRLTLQVDPTYAPAKHDLHTSLLFRKTPPNYSESKEP